MMPKTPLRGRSQGDVAPVVHVRAGGDLFRERVAVGLYIAVLALTTAHFTHDAWNAYFFPTRLAALVGLPSSPPKLYAPHAYRILIPDLVRAMHSRFPPLDEARLFTFVDLSGLVCALVALYKATADRLAPERGRPGRALCLALTLLFCTQSLVWAPQFLRPETMPTALYLALALLWTRRKGLVPLLLGAALTVVQAFSRADVPFVLGLAIMLAGVFSRSQVERRRLLLSGMCVALLAGAVQAYLQFVRFPHLSYDPQTPVVQLRNNLHLHMWSNSLLAILPVWATLLYGLRQGRAIVRQTSEAVPFFMGLLYLPLWLTVGLGSEVRIYVPVLMMMSPLAAAILTRAFDPTFRVAQEESA